MGGSCSVLCCRTDPRDQPIGRRLAMFQKRPEVRGSVRRDPDNRALIVDAYFEHPRGYLIFTRAFLPILPSKQSEIKGLICYCQGYSATMDWFTERNFIKLAQGGYILFTLDHFGHGRSDGLWVGHEMNQIIEDARWCFEEFRNQLNDPLSTVRLHLRYSCKSESEMSESALTQESWNECPSSFDDSNCFLMGHSMGGAIAVSLALSDPERWRGMVMLAPMVSIHENIKPPDCLIAFGDCCLVPCCPTKKWTPVNTVVDYLFQESHYLEEFRANPLRYDAKPRLNTAMTMYKFTLDLEKMLHSLKMPFLVMHGSADQITDPVISQRLYDAAESEDKAIHIYESAWHSLYADPFSRDVIHQDILAWIDTRVGKKKQSKLNSEKDGSKDE